MPRRSVHPQPSRATRSAEIVLERIEAARARSPRAGLAAVERALARLGKSMSGRDGHAALEARLVRSRGHALRALGRHREAARDYEAASRRFVLAQLPVESARCAIGWIDALMYLGRDAQARRIAANALKRFERAGERAAAARLLNNVANLEYRLDRPVRALALYVRARRGLAGDSAAVARVDANRANCMALRGRPGDAARLLVQARREFTRAGRIPDAAGCDYALAYLLFLQHRYAEALFALAALEPVFDRLGAEDYRLLLDTDSAEIYLRLGQPSEAATAAARAANRAEALGLRYEGAKSCYFEGVAHAARGDFATARRRLVRAARAFARERNRIWEGQCELARAECDLAEGKPSRAAIRARRAARVFARSGDPIREGLALVLVGRSALTSGRSARPELMRARALARRPGATFLAFRVACLEGDQAVAAGTPTPARRAYGRAIKIAESLAGRVQSELFRATDWTAWEDAYPRMVALEVAAGRPSRVFRALERARARAFERIQPGGVGEVRPFVPRFEARLRALACRIEARSFGRSPGAAVPEPWTAPQQQERREVARQLDRLEREASGRRGSSPPATRTLAEVQGALGAGDLVLEYFVLPDRVGVFSIDARVASLHETLLTSRELATALDEIAFLARSSAGRLPGAGRALERALADIGRALLEKPLAAARARGLAARHLIVVPSGSLVALPWPALHSAMVSVVPSLSFWRAGRSRRLVREPVSVTARRRPTVVLVGLGDDELPAVTREIARIANLVSGARVLTGKDATVARVRRAVQDADWLHVAGHGRHDVDRPMLSAVRLADRWAYLPDLAPGGQSARGVILAACRTGSLVGGFRNDWQGLAGGLLRAGTRAVLASPWDADDRATQGFTTALYERLVQGATLGEALLEARKQCLQKPLARWSASAWTLLGDATTVLANSSSGSRRPLPRAVRVVLGSSSSNSALRGEEP
jgi:tetratricopeptide (TPR) repeat protein